MAIVKTFLPGIVLGLAVAAAASPSLAQRTEQHMNANREKVMHDCSVEASKYTQSTWATTQLSVYRSCMMQHGQPE
jgi:hypothetical protein